DPMNADETLLRSRVRHRALPLLREILGEHLDENLARTADLVGPDADHLDAEATALLDSLRRDGGELREERDLLLLDVHALAAAPAPLRTRVLRDASRSADRAMARHGGAGSTKSLLRRQVLAIDALVVSWHGQSAVTVPGRIEVARRDGLWCGAASIREPRPAHPTTFHGGDPRAPDAPPPRCRPRAAGRAADPRSARRD